LEKLILLEEIKIQRSSYKKNEPIRIIFQKKFRIFFFFLLTIFKNVL